MLFTYDSAGEVIEITDVTKAKNMVLMASSAEQAREMFEAIFKNMKGKNIFDVLRGEPFDD